jgi:pyridoxal phosphate enzyme (YggS family)
MGVHQNLIAIHRKIREYEDIYLRPARSVCLLGASKDQSLEKMQGAIAAGQRIFGENYVQEALLKIAALENKTLEWHFIGAIQSNKTKKIAENFDWVQSVCSEYVATRLSEQRSTHLSPLNICIEVNISGEASKSGIAMSDLLPLAELCRKLPNVTLRGLMAVPAHKETLKEQRVEFNKLRVLFDGLNDKGFSLDTLSMGMSNDMEAAIAEGSTMIRIGTAFFGPREKSLLMP